LLNDPIMEAHLPKLCPVLVDAAVAAASKA
jgi:hypothetical protein